MGMTGNFTTGVAYLDSGAGIPVDQPFTRATALREGVSDRQLCQWVGAGLLANPMRGVYHASQLSDGLELRASCLRLIAPSDAVITDETAGWFHGASMILAPNDHLVVPRVSMFLTPGNRLRNEFARSGERTFLADEVIDLHGVRVTSALRTTCDLGRATSSDRAFAGMEAMANLPELDLAMLSSTAKSKRYRGYRRVIQLRAWVSHVRRGVQSPEESVLRKRWIECPSLPYPEPQVPVPGPHGHFHVDMGNEELRYGAEYDGDKWHGPDQQEYDATRRAWLESEEGWTIDVFRRQDVYGREQKVRERLIAGVISARKRAGSAAWHGQDRVMP